MIGKNCQVSSLRSQPVESLKVIRLEQWNGGIMDLKETKFKAHILLGFSYFIGVF